MEIENFTEQMWRALIAFSLFYELKCLYPVHYVHTYSDLYLYVSVHE